MWIEVSVFVTNILYILLVAFQKRVGWLFGILGALLFVWSNIEQQLYMDASLNSYYVIAGIYGWWIWGKHGAEGGLSISTIPRLWIVWISIVCILLILTLGMILHRYTHSNISYIDTTVTIFSFIATWMATRKYIENWLLWLIADPLAIVLYALKGDHLYALLFLLYTLMAAYGYYQWRKQLNLNAA